MSHWQWKYLRGKIPIGIPTRGAQTVKPKHGALLSFEETHYRFWGGLGERYYKPLQRKPTNSFVEGFKYSLEDTLGGVRFDLETMTYWCHEQAFIDRLIESIWKFVWRKIRRLM